MSEEERIRRSEVGHDANDLHKHGGLDAHDEEKTEREDLEEAIEALQDYEASENIEAVESDASSEEPVSEPEVKEEQPAEEPKNDWKKKEENKQYMTIDEVREPKKEKKGGAGWKVATFAFLILAIAGCGVAAYLFFNNGKVEFLGRRVTSEKSEKSENAITEPVKAPDDTPIADNNNNNGRLIYLDGYDLALKIPDTLTNVSYEYYQNNEGGCPECTWSSNYSTLELNAAYKNGAISAAPFASQTEDDMYPMGAITITSGKPNYEASAPELVTTIETNDPDIKYSIYYNHPQQGFCNGKYADCAKWESQSVAEIEKMLMNKDNYIKLSK